MDALINRMEFAMNKFVTKCRKIKKITTWSSLVALTDLDELLKSKKTKEANLVHATIQSFYDKIIEFKLSYPKPPTNMNDRGTALLSLNDYFNDSFAKAISTNLFYSK
jgi:hypothetical protein